MGNDRTSRKENWWTISPVSPHTFQHLADAGFGDKATCWRAVIGPIFTPMYDIETPPGTGE